MELVRGVIRQFPFRLRKLKGKGERVEKGNTRQFRRGEVKKE